MREKLTLVVSELRIVRCTGAVKAKLDKRPVHCRVIAPRSRKHPCASLNAAKEALLAAMPEKARAMTQKALFEKAGVKTTGLRALGELLVEGKIRRTGKSAPRDLYRYFALKK